MIEKYLSLYMHMNNFIQTFKYSVCYLLSPIDIGRFADLSTRVCLFGVMVKSSSFLVRVC